MDTKKKGKNIFSLVVSFVAVVLAVFLSCSILIIISKFNLYDVYIGLFTGSFGSKVAIGQTLARMCPILFCSTGLIIAFRCGVWNVGAEGQIYLGALGATLIGVYISNLAPVLHIFLAIIVSFIFGGVWAGICGFLKTKFNANEVITTLLSNFIAINLTFYFLKFHLQPANSYNPSSAPINASAVLPTIVQGTLVHAGLLLAILCVIGVWFLMSSTSLGYSIDSVGSNQNAAKYSGENVKMIILISMFLSGGLAGIGGMGEVLGIHHLLIRNVSPNYGYIAIAVVFISRLKPFGAIAVSLFFGAVLTGGRYIQTIMGVPTHLVDIIVALFIIFMLIQPIIENKVFSAITSRKLFNS